MSPHPRWSEPGKTSQITDDNPCSTAGGSEDHRVMAEQGSRELGPDPVLFESHVFPINQLNIY